MLEYKYFATTFLWTFFSEKYFFVYIFFSNLGSLNFEKMEEVFGDAWKHLHVSSKEIENATEKVFLNYVGDIRLHGVAIIHRQHRFSNILGLLDSCFGERRNELLSWCLGFC